MIKDDNEDFENFTKCEDSYVYGNVKVRGHCHIVISQVNIEALRIEIVISTLH